MHHEQDLKRNQHEIFRKVEERKDPYPVCVEIHPTDVCNQGCEYCFHGGNGFGNSRDRNRFLSAEEYDQLLAELSRLGIRIISISGGGEQFLSKDASAIIGSALSHDLDVRIVSHGNFLPVEALPLLIQCEEIRFSVDTPDAETYSQVRKVHPKMHERTLQNIATLVEAKKQMKGRVNIGAAFIIGEINKLQVLEFASLMLDQIGVDVVTFKYDIYGEFKPGDEQDDGLREQLERAKQLYGKRVEIRPYLGDYKGGHACVVPYFKSVINPYGELFSCCLGAQPGEKNGYLFGDVLREMRHGNNNAFASVWSQSRQIRVDMLEATQCESCNHTDRQINNAFLERR